MIILFPPGGRTGNQLFQTAYCMTLAGPRGYFFTRGFGKTRGYFYGTWKRRWINVDAKWLCWIIERLVEPFCWQVFLKTGLVSSRLELQGQVVKIRRGFIPRITIVKGFFENDSFDVDRIRRDLKLKRRYMNSALGVLKRVPKGSNPVFIHIRHGDFATELLGGMSIQLPDSYYEKAIQLLREKISNPFFIITGDDPEYAESFFKDMEYKYVSRLSVPEDLALMSLCEGGILSNSTFAWWGAFLGNPKGYYIGPRYWSGWAVKEWRPRGMDTGMVSLYIDVEPDPLQWSAPGGQGSGRAQTVNPL